MSRFLVCWHRGGAPIAPGIATIADAMRARDGVTPPRRLDRGDVACWHWPSGWVTGAEERLPLEEQGWIGGGTLRLDDRASLERRLRDRGELHTRDDAALAWASMRAWGADAAEQWIGDFAVAVVAPARERMVVSRSAFGIRACFVASLGECVAVSDDLGLLVDLMGGPTEPPPEAIAEYLAFGQLMSRDLTFHRGIRRVPAGVTLVVERDGRVRATTHRALPEPAIRHDREDRAVIEEFRALLDTAVRDRLRASGATLLLSGGLDSAALAVAARRAAPQALLSALTVEWSSLIPDAEAATAAITAHATGLAHDVIRPAADLGLRDVAPFRTPEPVPDSEAGLTLINARALAARAPLAILGEDPDTLLAPPTLLGVLANEGLTRTWRAWSAFRRDEGTRPWIGARQSVFAAEQRAARRQERIPTWLRAPYARLAHRAGPGPAHPTRERAARALRHPLWEACAWLDDPALTGADVVTVLPFMDPRVIEFCFSLPAIPWLQRKRLMRRLLRDEVPAEVTDRPKVPLTGYFEARVAAWRRLGAPVPLPAPVEEWVEHDRWARALAETCDADTVLAAWRVLELSRWLAQPRHP